MKEIIFEVTEDPIEGFSASALGWGIHTQGNTLDDLKFNIREALDCYFDDDAERPSVARLHFVRDELIAL